MSGAEKAGSDPFEVEPLPRTFYHPSQSKELSEREKKTCLTSSNQPAKEDLQKVTSPEDLKFLKGTNKLQVHEVPTRENGTSADHSSSTLFNESWPSTDRTVSTSTPEGRSSTPEMSHQMRDWLYGIDDKPNKTTLGWFISRFRNAPPTTREQRDRAGLPSGPRGGDFWWLSPPSGSSTPLNDTPPQKLTPSPRKSSQSSPKTDRGSRPMILTSLSASGTEDHAISDLQKRADELLEKSGATIESTSTEPFQPIRRPLPSRTSTSKLEQGPAKADSLPHPRPVGRLKTSAAQTKYQPRRPANPEDDILYQWRLSRKLELAQNHAVSAGVPKAHGVKRSYLGSEKVPADGTSSLGQSKERLPSRAAFSEEGTVHLLAQHALPTSREVPSDLEVQNTGVPQRSAVLPSEENVNAKTESSRVSQMGADFVPIATPFAEVSRPCSHQVTKQKDQCPGGYLTTGVPPHMHLSCDILPCPHNHHGNQKPCSHGDRWQKPTPSETYPDEEKENFKSRIKGLGTRKEGFPKKTEISSTQQKDRVEKSGDWKKEKAGTSSDVRPVQRERPDKRLTENEGERRRRKQRQAGPKQDTSSSTDVLGNVISKVVSEHMQFSSSSDDDSGTTTSQGQAEISAVSTHPQDTVSQRQAKTSTASTCPQASVSQRQATASTSPKESSVSQRDEVTAFLEESSEDEFLDDEILRVLRQKSKSYREKLRRIDNLLDQGN